LRRKKKKRRTNRKTQMTAAARRKKLLQFLESDTPGWKDSDHPELKNGTAAWVRKLRGH
jgi:hypothetical protein